MARVRRSLMQVVAWAACMLPVLTAPVQAQPLYPSKPIRFIVPYPPGGGTDVVARLLAGKMSESLGQQVLVENRPGASTIIGTDAVAKATPDGYTIGMVTDSHAINFGFKRQLPYTEASFTPVIQLLNVPFVLLANTSSGRVPANNLRELVALAKAQPGKFNFASLGSGSPHELAMLWLNKVAGIDITVVAYRGIGPALTDVLGGQADLMFAGSSVANEYIKAGRLRALATTTPKRTKANPNLPAIAEDYPEMSLITWYGIVGPAGMPAPVTARLHDEFAKALQSDDVKRHLATLGAEAAGGTPAEFEKLILAETAKWTRVIQLTGAKPE